MNNDNLLQLEGAIESVVFRNDENGYTVIELADGDDYLTAVGIMPQVSCVICHPELSRESALRPHKGL